jgi:hypothetical protein
MASICESIERSKTLTALYTGAAPTSTSSYDERLAVVLAHAESMGQHDAMEQVISVFSFNHRIFVRPYKRGIVIAPNRAKNRYLAYFAPRTDGIMAFFGIEPIQEFFPEIDSAALLKLPSNHVWASLEAFRDWASSVSSAVVAVPRPDDE